MRFTVAQLMEQLSEFNSDSEVHVTVCPLDGDAMQIKDVYADCMGVMIEIQDNEE